MTNQDTLDSGATLPDAELVIGDTMLNPEPVPTLTSQDERVTLTIGSLRMTIDGKQGARITEFSYEGKNVLTGPEVNPSNFGSTFWPSPQNLWGWPPVAALDSAPYTATVDGTSVQFTSRPGSLGQHTNAPIIQVMKRFIPVPGNGSIDVTYTLTNVSPAEGPNVDVAPWQITRVRGTQGLTFFAVGKGPIKASQELPIDVQNGIGWYRFSPANTDAKTFADGQGWIAHVTGDRTLLVLRFEDLDPDDSPTGESEIELYTGSPHVAGDYVEIEPQGRKQLLAPSQSLTWTVRFYLRALPADLTATVGNAALVDLVRSILR
jgi:hypothetical protein